MLAGVGPVRLILFVVAANEGWRQQSEEHLAILDVLGVEGGVVALTKQDLVDRETLDLAEEQIRQRLEGSALESARLVRVSATTGDGLEELRSALDGLLVAAAPPPETRARLFVDRVFTISGAGTVVTGTLGGSALAVGDDVELYPHGRTARVRSLQTHKRDTTRAIPVARVAANLAGTGKGDLARGDVVGAPGAWRPTTTFDGIFRPVRGLPHPVTGRGAFKVYVGAAEADAKVRMLGRSTESGDDVFVRITTTRPLVLDVSDRFVLRESGRQETVGGGAVLDPAPPRRAGSAGGRLARRARRRATSSRGSSPTSGGRSTPRRPSSSRAPTPESGRPGTGSSGTVCSPGSAPPWSRTCPRTTSPTPSRRANRWQRLAARSPTTSGPRSARPILD